MCPYCWYDDTLEIKVWRVALGSFIPETIFGLKAWTEHQTDASRPLGLLCGSIGNGTEQHGSHSTACLRHLIAELWFASIQQTDDAFGAIMTSNCLSLIHI